MTNNQTSVLHDARAPRLEGRISYNSRGKSVDSGSRSEQPAVNSGSVEYEAAKWFGPWTVLINRRIGGSLFRTSAQKQ
jgi:hypothetical protein